MDDPVHSGFVDWLTTRGAVEWKPSASPFIVEGSRLSQV
jgi:hypothetical protein